MPSFVNSLVNATLVELVANEGKAASGNSTPIDITTYEGQLIFCAARGEAGAAGTCALKVQHCDTETGQFEDAAGGGFTTVAQAALTQAIPLDTSALKQWVQLLWTIAGLGQNETVPLAAVMVGMKKYQ